MSIEKSETVELLTLPPIPEGVYYAPEHDNFYAEQTHVGMGLQFYAQWKSRADEFPK